MATLAPSDFTLLQRHAAMADEAGIDALGPGDSPLYHDPYVSASVVAGATRRIRVGPMVTNLVARAPFTIARALASVEDLAGSGRTFAGVGAGDSALAAVGRKPLGVDDFRTALGELRAATTSLGRETGIVVAANGPRTMAMADGVADAVASGNGIDQANIEALVARVTHAEPWVVCRTSIGPNPDRALDELLPLLASGANHVFAAPRNRALLSPDELAGVEQLRARYDYGSHGRPADQNPNAQLIDELGIRDLLAARFATVGDVQAVAARFVELADAGIRGVMIPVIGVDIERLLTGLAEVVRLLRD
ncbi:MAG: LLM class flavin-dependent oxidoreductase [Microthrixaceae bacterium]